MKSSVCVIVAASCISFSAWAQKGGQPQVDVDTIQKAMGALQQQAAAGAGQVVDFRQLKALLPEKLGDLKRTNAKGSKNSSMGITVSQAEATYEGPNDATADIEISDTAGLGGLGAFAQMAMIPDVDSESDTGYEKTYTHKGVKVMERYDSEDHSGEITTVVGGRFTVKISMNNIKPEQLKAALDAMDLNKLAALKPEAPKK